MRTDYEQLAARYDEDREKYSYERDNVVAALLQTRQVVVVVDIGCGTGRWLHAQYEFFGDARLVPVGVDPSPAMLLEARRKQLPNLAVAPAEDLPLKDATADYVVVAYCFHHFTDKERALDEISRVLVDEGVLCLNNINPFAPDRGWLYEFFPEAIAVDAARFWPADRLAAALEARGFAVDIELESGAAEMSATEALADAARRVISQLAVLDDDAYARGLARLREVAAGPDATVPTSFSRLGVTARRLR